jgi:V/A-type H+-transporting ATPase subunit E
MALEDIIEKIAQEAAAEADRIHAEADAEKERISREAKKQSDSLAAELRARGEEKARGERERRLNMARLEHRRRVLAERQKAINAVFDLVKERIAQLSDEEFTRFAVSLLRWADPDGDEEIIPPASTRSRFSPQVIAAMNASLGGRGNLTLAGESGDFEGGFILRKGPRRDDLTLDCVLLTVRHELEPKLAGILFGKGAST